MSSATEVERAVRDRRRVRPWTWLAVIVMLVGGLVWLWFAWLLLILDYSRGYDDASYNAEMTLAELVAACSEPASEDYPSLDWSGGEPPPDAGRHVRAFFVGCVDAGHGRSFNPWRIWGGATS